jgi:hypothetical protein
MKKLLFLCVVVVCVLGEVSPGINFGNGSGFIVTNGASLDVSGAELTGGTIKTEGGTLIMDEPLTGHNTTISIQNAGYDPRTITFDGILDDTDTLTLGDDQFLEMKGTIVTQALVATGSHGFPSMLRGIGNTIGGAGIGVATGATLRIDLAGTLDASIELQGDGDAAGEAANTSKVLLASDLTLAPGRGITTLAEGGVNIVNCAGHRLTLGGFLEGPAVISGSQDWMQANVHLTGPLALDENSVLNLFDTAYFNGNGNTFTFVSRGTSGFNVGDVDCTFVDMIFTNMSVGCMINTVQTHLRSCIFKSEDEAQSVEITGDIVAGPFNIFDGAMRMANALIVLQTNVALQGVWSFAAGAFSLASPIDAVTTAPNVIDLNGNTLDFSDANAGLALLDSFMTVTIRNGRITNLSAEKITGTPNSYYIFENVEFVLADDTILTESVAYTLKGHCVMSALQPGLQFINESLLSFTIASGSSLTLGDGVVYCHANAGEANFVFADSSSRLELMGATFRRNDVESGGGDAPDALMLKNGCLIIDHISYLQPGSKGIQIGDGITAANNLTIEIRPSATLTLGSGGDASSGVVTYANVAEVIDDEIPEA